MTSSDIELQKSVEVCPKNHLDSTGNKLISGHASWQQIKDHVGEEVWREYHKICIIRNPWDRVISQFYFRQYTVSDPPRSFSDFVVNRKFTTELDNYASLRGIEVDTLIRYEHLREDLKKLALKIGLPWDQWIPYANATNRPISPLRYRIYSTRLAEIVEKQCKREILLHNYRFDQSKLLPDPSGKNPGQTLQLDESQYDVNVLSGNSTTLVKNELVSTEYEQDNVTLKNQNTGEVCTLNPTAAEIWNLLDGNRSLDQIFDTLHKRFLISSGELSTDIYILVDELLKRGFLRGAHSLLGQQNWCQFDLRDIPFYIINCRSDTDRANNIIRQMRTLRLRFEFVDGIKSSNKKKGIAKSHIKVLENLNIDPPFVILEDDCQFTDSIQWNLEVPQDADALYLGISRFGSDIPGTLSRAKRNNVRFASPSKGLARIFNMLSRHAILYLSNRFRESAISAVSNGMKLRGMDYPGDAYYAMIQASHQVYAKNIPLCFQNKALRGVQDATQFILTEQGKSRVRPRSRK